MSALLSSLAIGALSLTPEFDSEVFEYTAETTNATNKITAVAEDEDAKIEILVNDVEIENEESATWVTGVNTVVVNVTNGEETEAYSVAVTASSGEVSGEPEAGS